jgi:ribosomal protein L22
MLPTKPKQNKMDSKVYEVLKKDVQEIIDLIAGKQNKEANNKLVEVSETLDELLDHAEEDEELVELGRYMVLLNQLHQKINAE